MKRYIVHILGVLVMMGCGVTSTATPELDISQATADQMATAPLMTQATRAEPTPEYTPSATPTDVPAPTSTRPPRATETPTAMPTIPSEPEGLTDLAELEELLDAVYEETPSVSVSGGEVAIVIDTTPFSYFGDELKGIELAEKAELYIYSGVYHILGELAQVDAVTVEVQLDGQPAYQARASRKDAYSFRSGTLGSSNYESHDPSTLALTAVEQNLIGDWTVLYLAPDIEKALSNPSPHDVTAVVQNWTTTDILDASVNAGVASVQLDLSELANLYYDTYGRKDPVAQEEVNWEAALNTANALYGLFIRFPSLHDIAIEVLINGESHSAHRCTRDQFNEIGPDMFFLGGPREDPEATLELLQP